MESKLYPAFLEEQIECTFMIKIYCSYFILQCSVSQPKALQISFGIDVGPLSIKACRDEIVNLAASDIEQYVSIVTFVMIPYAFSLSLSHSLELFSAETLTRFYYAV